MRFLVGAFQVYRNVPNCIIYALETKSEIVNAV